VTFRSYYVTFRPQFGAPKALRLGANVPLSPLVTTQVH